MGPDRFCLFAPFFFVPASLLYLMAKASAWACLIFIQVALNLAVISGEYEYFYKIYFISAFIISNSIIIICPSFSYSSISSIIQTIINTKVFIHITHKWNHALAFLHINSSIFLQAAKDLNFSVDVGSPYYFIMAIY